MATSKIPFNKPNATWEQIVTGTNSTFVGVFVPIGASSGKITKLSCLGQPIINVDYDLTISISADKRVGYLSAGGNKPYIGIFQFI